MGIAPNAAVWWSAAILLLSWIGAAAVRALEWLWWRPKRVQRLLTKQGIRGSPYRFLFGDSMEDQRLMREAQSKPMSLSHDFIPRVTPFFFQSLSQHGKFSLSWFGPNPRVTIVDPELVTEVMNNRLGCFGRDRSNPFGRLLLTGLVSYDSEKWAKHRRILSPAFHFEKLKNMLPEFTRSCTDMIDRWLELVGSAESYEMDVFPELRKLTADVISRAAFGSRYEEGELIFQLLTEQALLVGQSAPKASIPGYRFLPLKGSRRMKEISKEIKSIIRGMIEVREKAIKSGKAIEDNLLGLLLHSNMDYQEDGNKQKGMTIDDVVNECKLFYFAGQETTNVLLTWTMILLSMNPVWQDRAREEVLQAFGKNKPCVEGLNHLKIVNMILHETLRLYPPAVCLFRRTCESVKLGEFTIPAGVTLALPVIFLHHDKEIWGEDAEEFHPERFSEGVTKATTKQQQAFFPFGWGPRICIGQNFALMESKMAIAMILQHFSFELSPSYTHAPHTLITLKPQHGAQIILHKL